MRSEIFERLLRRRLLNAAELAKIIAREQGAPLAVEQRLRGLGIAKHELQHCLAEVYGVPVAEFDETIVIPAVLFRALDPEKLKMQLWLPLGVNNGTAGVILWDPADEAVLAGIRSTLGAGRLECQAALPSDIIRIIEHNQDINPGYSPSAGRTPLAKVRTFLADRRSRLACFRNSFAQGRTGLAFFRTGLSFLTMSLVLFRIFGNGWLTPLMALLAAAGVVMLVDGFRWYLPARATAAEEIDTGPSAGSDSGILTATWTAEHPWFRLDPAGAGAASLRGKWQNLSPVMRRRFLANDRTNFAAERTLLAGLRTRMARARTGLAFARTGTALAGLGIALLRIKAFQTIFWTDLDLALIGIGIVKIAEGFHWYLPGRRAGNDGLASVRSANSEGSIWESLFPPAHARPENGPGALFRPPVTASQAPGIWATTGLALERTVLAERRNVMARLRTIMARARTGLAFIRTGMSISAVGAGLLVSFGFSSTTWSVLYVVMTLLGLLIIVDGVYWYRVADRTRREFPYCTCDVEIAVPDYGRPARSWTRALFSHDDL